MWVKVYFLWDHVYMMFLDVIEGFLFLFFVSKNLLETVSFQRFYDYGRYHYFAAFIRL